MDVPQIRGFPFFSDLLGVTSCEVAIVWPEHLHLLHKLCVFLKRQNAGKGHALLECNEDFGRLPARCAPKHGKQRYRRVPFDKRLKHCINIRFFKDHFTTNSSRYDSEIQIEWPLFGLYLVSQVTAPTHVWEQPEQRAPTILGFA